MAQLSLRINIVDSNVTKTMVFDPSTTVYDACRIIREKITEANLGQAKDYGLFLTDEDNNTGVWLESGRQLAYYILRSGDMLEYRKKVRTLRVKMLDGSVKTMLVDDSQIVANLMVVICTKIGITNHDEYSLVLEERERDEKENLENRNYSTLTLKRKKEEKERDAKMEQLRKKLRTDDEVNWVDPSKTLREQGIDENETVLLRRKFFYSDQNIDSRDPVQLNLLYVQARDAIIGGTHPVTQEKACEFAGIQCQIQFGDYVENKHKPGFLDLKEFLPQSYVRVKGIEKKIYNEHKKHIGLSELDAKVLYTKIARSLKTYGVTFFLVKEKMKGKNKLVPRLLGITKDSVLRLDEKTKEILKTWPLTTVRRWGASPNTFTLDFGDYSDQYYSVQTTEAEQIQQIIAGYIDIILKKKQAKDHFGIEGDEGSTMVEDSVSPHKATILQHETNKIGKINTESVAKPAVMRAGADGPKPYGTGHVGGAQYTTVSGQINLAHTPPSLTSIQQTRMSSVLTEPQNALLSTITATQERIRELYTNLSAKSTIPVLGTDISSKKWKQITLDTRKQNVGSQIAAMNAATAQVVTLTSATSEEVDHTAVGAAITTIGSNLPEMTKDVKMIAALMDDKNNGEKLLDAAKKLCNAFSDLLKAAEPETKEPRQNLLNAASRVGEASTQVLTTLGDDSIENKELQDMLLSLAKVVANTTAALVLKAKNIAATCEDQQTQNKVIGAATQCALATSQLVACAKVIAPTLHSSACQEQLTAAVKEVTRAVEKLVKTCSEACREDDLLNQLNAAAADVSASLNNLLKHIEGASKPKLVESMPEASVETIYMAADKLTAASGDAGEMIKQARVLGQATARLIESIKGEAEKHSDSDVQKRLLAAAKTLADATARMVEAARQCASSPHDVKYQNNLRRMAEDLRDVTTIAASTPALRSKLVNCVQLLSRQAVSSATQCISAAQLSYSHNSNPVTREALSSDTQEVAEKIPALVEAIKAVSNESNDTTQSEIMYIAEVFLHPSTRFVQTSQSVLSTISEELVSQQLSQTTQKFNSDLNELRNAIYRAKPACQGLSFDVATHQISCLLNDLEEYRHAVNTNSLRPLPEDTFEKSVHQLECSSKAINQNVAQILTAISQGEENFAAEALRETVHDLKLYVASIRGVAATIENSVIRKEIIESAKNVIQHSYNLVKEAKLNLQPQEISPELATLSKRVSDAITSTISLLPGQRDIDNTISDIKRWEETIGSKHFPFPDKSYGDLQEDLNKAAVLLNETSTQIVNSVRNPTQLASSSRQFGSAFSDLLDTAMKLIGQTKDVDTQHLMIDSFKNVSNVSNKLLTAAKLVSSDPDLPNGKNLLSASARAVTSAINRLIDSCTSAAPGQTECDNAVRNIEAMKPLLDNPSEPINDYSFYECLDVIMEKSKMLGEGMTGITNGAKQSNQEKFIENICNVSSAVCGVIDAAAQAAYLVGVSDPSSAVGRPGLVDQAHFARAAQSIREGCSSLTSMTSSQQQVLAAATVIAKHTSALCNACRMASSKTTNPVAKRQFVQSAKDVANSTAHLVKEIKALDLNYSAENRNRCNEATKPLLDAVDMLCLFSSSSEFASIPAKISSQARASQEPIVNAGQRLIESSCDVINSARSLIIRPQDPPTWQQFATFSKSVSNSIKDLVSNLRDKAPGQTECDSAITALTNYLRMLDSANMDIMSQSPIPKPGSTFRNFNQQICRAVAELQDTIENLRHIAKFEAEGIGHALNNMLRYFDPLVQGTVGALSHIKSSKQQELLIDQVKSVIEAAIQFVYATKDSGGNPKAVNVHPDIDEYAVSLSDALQELSSNLQHMSTQSGIFTGIIDNLTRAVTRLSDQRASLIMGSEDSYVNYQTRMVENAKRVAKISGEMATKAAMDPQYLPSLAAELSQKYTQLANDSIGAAVTSTNGEVSTKLKEVVQVVGAACIDLVQSAERYQTGNDITTLKELGEYSRIISEKVSRVLALLQSGSRGTQACINAASTVSGIIGDLDTTIMFATAGNLNPDNENELFANHRENILKTAKALVEDTKTLVAGAASSQEQLAIAAQNAVSTIVQLAEVVKFGAASLGSDNTESQIMLINAVKDVASALGDLIHATKGASGKPISDPTMAHLKDSAKVMVTNVTSLLKTVKAVEDEHTRGTRALESTIEAIGQEMRALNSSNGAKSGVTREDLIRCTKAITKATSKSVAAGISNKQDDIICAANMTRKAISDMLVICKSTAYNLAENKELRNRILQAGLDCAHQSRELLSIILQGNDAKHALPQQSRLIAQSVTELVTVAELLKGSDWTEPDDFTIIAENELLGAAASIDAAAKKLAGLQPRKQITKDNDVDAHINFDEMILEAAKTIAAATSALVKAASAAQRELIDSGKVSKTPVSSSDDGQWSEGLISAARLVAAATHSLVESANALVQGLASEEKLISSAKQVASSTAHLLVACKVKAEGDTEATRRLQQAGNAVIRSTDNLVRAAQKAISVEEERSLILNKRMVGGIAQEINARYVLRRHSFVLAKFLFGN
ncbi:talin-2 isoform X1 [Agrilus planipennis]|uniref:Talin-2 isoform X1 n=1 Tax=Agrilus planipennis TaxID=224129 RepID=A0A7F5R5X3_AGRPL|nr:talin-2 isoform X1 [Agrilus planipennis]XP_025831318.1 talin-2 isoform X1 [Agrilus planipennis]XP_025831319.1 talin-2 isoform X1 [Agrilus planipennis]